MKKVLFLIFASSLVLGACGNHDSEKKVDNKSSDHKKSNDPKKDKETDNKKDESDNNKQVNSDETTDNESQSTSKNDNGKSQDNNGNEERTQSKQATQQQQQNTGNQQTNNQQVQGTPVNKDMPVAHDGGQNGYGYGDYVEAKKASEQARNGQLQGVGGSWGVAPGQDFNSWREQQAQIQNERGIPDN